jgi:hypothetical protein
MEQAVRTAFEGADELGFRELEERFAREFAPDVVDCGGQAFAGG